MSHSIPSVKEWIVTLESGAKLRVLAPTRTLALLNLRAETFAPVKSIGLARHTVGTHRMVSVAYPDRPCRYCGARYSAKGMARHVERCAVGRALREGV